MANRINSRGVCRPLGKINKPTTIFGGVINRTKPVCRAPTPESDDDRRKRREERLRRGESRPG